MQSKTPRSAEWRCNISSIQPIELANAIRALRKVVGVVDNRITSVRFNSEAESAQWEGEIVIDPAFATKSQPIQPEAFDVLVGLAAHEAGHSRVRSSRVKSDMSKAEYAQPIPENLKQLVAELGEEVYVDSHIRREFPILGHYITAARMAYDREGVDWADFGEVWKAIALFGHQLEADKISPSTLKCLAICLELTQQLLAGSVSAAQRVILYVGATKALAAQLKAQRVQETLGSGLQVETTAQSIQTTQRRQRQGPNQNPTPDTGRGPGQDPRSPPVESVSEPDVGLEKSDAQNTATTDGLEGGVDADHDSGKAIVEADHQSTVPVQSQTGPLSLHVPELLNPELARQVAEALAANQDDITDQLTQTFGAHTTEQIPPTTWSMATTQPDTYFNESLAQQLAWMRELKNEVGRQTLRGEARGRIDPTRLYRAATTGKVFKTTQRRPQQRQDLVLLVDASSSMDDSPIYEDVKALHHVLPDAKIISYSGHRGHVDLVVHSLPGERHLRQIRPLGPTPSGVGLLATAMRYPTSLIIHFTDGMNNLGPGVREVLELTSPKYPKMQVLHVEMGKAGLVGAKIEHIPNVRTARIKRPEEFPDVLKSAVYDFCLI